MVGTKICEDCKKEKDTEEFGRINRWGNGERKPFCKECYKNRVNYRYRGRKEKVVSLMGGACKKCGYNKNVAALHMHHLNPDEKEETWTSLQKRPWEKIAKEIEKCILLCANCHAELHNPEETVLNTQCEACGDDAFGSRFCSHECAMTSMRKVERPSREEFETLLKKTSMYALAKKYGVQPTAIKNWAEFYGLTYLIKPSKRPVVSKKPEKEEFSRVFSEKKVCELAKMYSVGHSAIRLWAIEYGLVEDPKHPQGAKDG